MVGMVQSTAMTIAAAEAQGEEIARAASPARDLRRRLGEAVFETVAVASSLTDSGVAAGWRVLMAQASLRIWMML